MKWNSCYERMKLHHLHLLAIFSVLVSGLFLCSCTKTKTRGSSGAGATSLSKEKAVETIPYTDISLKAQGQRVPVIMYHDVVKHKTVWFDTTADEFEQQMHWITSEGITPISLDQLYKHLTAGEPIPEKSIVLTFDDNYQGFFDNAVPILEQFKFPAAMFVHTKFVGDKQGPHPKMDWPTLKQLIKDPLITIGSHTVTHPVDITQLSQEDQIKELTE